jgi:L-ascorbate metabolism protein UlaG (beta-lactamase superfamily)
VSVRVGSPSHLDRRVSGAEITYVGHGSVLVSMDGVVLFTDPVLRGRVAHLRRAVPPVNELPVPDAVLVSHQHGDHLDPRSLQRLGREIRLVAPPGATQYLRRRGFEDVTELRPGEEVAVGPVTVRATRADHGGSRRRGRSGLAIGYLIEGTRRVYFAGDTDVFPEMAELGPVDVALLPIWGWGPTLGPGHLDPSSAARAAALLSARVVVPIHWGTYAPAHVLVRSRPAYLDEPPGRFRAEAASAAPGSEVRVLAPGESTRV